MTTAKRIERGRSTGKDRLTPQRDAGSELTSLLRSAYQSTLDEAVPDDLMDLIRKLK